MSNSRDQGTHERRPAILQDDPLAELLRFFARAPAPNNSSERDNLFPEGVMIFATSIESYYRALARGGFRGRIQGYGYPATPRIFAFPLHVDDEITYKSPYNNGENVDKLEADLRSYGSITAEIAHVLDRLVPTGEAERYTDRYARLYLAISQYVDQAPFSAILADPAETRVYIQNVQPVFQAYDISPYAADAAVDDFRASGKGGVVVALDARMLRRHGIAILEGDLYEDDCSLAATLVPLDTVIGIIPIGDFERRTLAE